MGSQLAGVDRQRLGADGCELLSPDPRGAAIRRRRRPIISPMKNELLLEFARRLMCHPGIACHEHAVREEVETICREHRLDCRRDTFGNVLVTLKTAPQL